MGDSYLNLAEELYYNKTWTREEFINRVSSYGKDNSIDENIISDFIREVFTKELGNEYSIEEKRAFLAAVTFKDGTLKYGEAVKFLEDARVEKCYEVESNELGPDETERLHNKLKGVSTPQVDPNGYRIVGGERTVIAPERNPLPRPVQPQNPQVDPNAYRNAGGERTVVDPQRTQGQTPETDPNAYRNVGGERTQTRPNAATSTPQHNEPQTNEDYERVLRNITEPEPESDVRQVHASEERINKLKKSKPRVMRYFLKSAFVVLVSSAALYMLLGFSGPVVAVGGYAVLASRIKNGKFNPQGNIGKFLKASAETVFFGNKYKKEKVEYEKELAKEERGRSR